MRAQGTGERKARKHTTITIPALLFARIKELIKDTGFSSVSDYATFVLRDTVADLEHAKRGGKGKGSRGEEGTIVKKLRDLGYV